MLRRLTLLIVAVVVLAIAIEPAVHSHPAASHNACAICAAGVTQLPASAPAVVAPAIVVSVVAPQPLPHVAVAVSSPRASRAPPAA